MFQGHVLLIDWPCGAIPLSMKHDLYHFPLLALTSKELEVQGPNKGTPLNFLNSTQEDKK
jgi:hypothetical protein